MSRMLWIAASIGCFVFDTAEAQSDPPVLAFGTYGQSPSEYIATGDVDNDGDNDFVTTSGSAAQAFIWRSDGVGGFVLVPPFPFISGGPSAVRLADLDLDGNLDLLATSTALNAVSVCRGKGNGTFFPKVGNPVGAYPIALHTGKLDNDVHLDVIAVNFVGGSVSVLLGDGSGGLQPAVDLPTQTPPAQTGPWDAALGDFDADGHMDIAVTNYSTDAVALLRGDGAGAFGAPALTAAADNPTYVSSADLDADGDLDLVVTFDVNPGIRTFVNDGGGNFVQTAFYPLPWKARSLTLGDVDGDGHADALTCSGWSGPVELFLGDGVGGFRAPIVLATDDEPVCTAITELTGDGLTDIAIGFKYTAEVSILRGLGDGRLVRPIGQGLGFGVSRFVLSDFDGDHRVDVATLANGQPIRMAVRFGVDGGTFGPGVDYPLSAFAAELALGDVDADGFLDLSLLFPTSGACRLQVYLGDGAGAFTAGPSAPVPAAAVDIATADLDGDGRSDVVTRMNNDATLAVSLADGAGGYAAPTVHALPWPADELRLEDFDGDDKVDVFVASGTTPEFVLLRGDGHGGFASSAPISCGEKLTALDVGDFVEDHRPDLVAGSGTKFHLFTNVGGGQFAQSSWSTLKPGPVTAADMNGDLHLDIISSSLDRTGVAFGDGQGKFYATQTFRTEAYASDFDALDLNGDSLPDLVVATSSSDGLFVSFNDTGCSVKSYCVAKLNSQGCLPTIDSNGTPSASASSGFVVRCLNAVDGQAGTLLYSLLGPQSQPFQGGTLCVQAPFSRTPVVSSGGSGPCTGVLSLDFNQFASGAHGGHPKPALRIPGTPVFAQWWGRDPGFAPPNDTQLSDALVFHMCP